MSTISKTKAQSQRGGEDLWSSQVNVNYDLNAEVVVIDVNTATSL
jgi:hypothetical protein